MLITHSSFGIVNLAEQERYARSVPEFPHEDLNKHDYQNLYDSLKPTWWEQALSFIGLKKGPAWQPTEAQTLIEAVSGRLQEAKRSQELTVPPGTEFLVFGGLHGAFHALVRTLQDLNNRGIMSIDYALKPQTYLIFLGDTIDVTAYSLETISLILTLMQLNKERVIFLAGERESNQTWHSSSLKKELDLRLPQHATELTQKLDLIFSRLPRELTVTLKGADESLLFSAFPQEKERKFTLLITGDEDAPTYQEGQGLYKDLSSNGSLTWQVVSSPVRRYRMHHTFFNDAYAEIKLTTSFKKSTISLYASNGILPFTHGSTYALRTGTLVSRGQALPGITAGAPSPVTLEQLTQYIETLQTQTKTIQAQIDLLKKQLPQQSVPSVPIESTPLLAKLKEGVPLTTHEIQQAGFEIELLYNTLSSEVDTLLKRADKKGLITALPHTSPKEGNTITLGSSLDLSKSAKGLGIPFKTGMSLAVHKQNREGGIHHKRVNIIFLDDAYLPAIARKNIEMLLNTYHTPFIIAPVGSPTLAGYLDLVQEKKILVLFPQSGSLLFRKPELTHIINYRASFNDEGRLLTEYVLENYRPKNFAFFYQDDEFGLSILEGAKQGLKDAAIPAATEVRYQANTTNFEAAAAKIKEDNPDALGFFATGPATVQLIRDIGVEFLANKILYAVSSVGDAATIKVLKDRGISLIMGQVVPDPETSKLPIVKEYRRELKKQGLREDVFSLETYITTSLTFDAMSKIEEPVTMEKLISYFEKMKNYDYKGLTLTFNPKNRSLAKSLWIINKEETAHLDLLGGSHEDRTV